MRIGVGITTHNRRRIFNDTYDAWKRHLPRGARLVVVDDGSQAPLDSATYAFKDPAGVARAKNKCLELLENLGCDEIFLADDDTYPLTDEWWVPYVESPEPHLMRIFQDLSGETKLNDIEVIYADERHVAYSAPRGCLVYVSRECLAAVGGMNPEYGRWGWEHGDWSNRIHNAGLTTWHYADVAGSDELIYCMDEHEEVDRSVPLKEREAITVRNSELFDSYRDSKVYVPYRTFPDIVVTTLFTRLEDPQRGYAWEPDVGQFWNLATSLNKFDTQLYVLHDEPLKGNPPKNVVPIQVPTGTNPYFQRWMSIFDLLRRVTEISRVWCVDATDVTLLRPPWDHMRADTLYVGSEPSTLDVPWLKQNHRATIVNKLIRSNRRAQLLNAGLVGGSRPVVLEFVHDMVRLIDNEARRKCYDGDTHDLGIGDMGAFQVVCHSPEWKPRIDYGPHVNTVFKSYEDNGAAWWMHK